MLVRVGYGLRTRELRPVVGDDNAEAEPAREMGDGFADMAAADDDNLRSWFDRLHVDLHLSAANPDIAFLDVAKRIRENARLSVRDRSERLADDAAFHIAAANRSFDAAVTEDDHLAAVMARDRSLRSDYGSDGERLTLAFELSEFRVNRHDGDAFYRTRPRTPNMKTRQRNAAKTTHQFWDKPNLLSAAHRSFGASL